MKKKKEQAFGDGGFVEGIVQNYMSTPCQEGALSRWMKSVFTGVPFTTDPNRISFNVLDPDSVRGLAAGGNIHSAHVQIYGNITAGDISNGRKVKVWGKKDSNNVIYASKIQDSGTGVITSFGHSIPAAIPRIVTLLIVLIPVILFFYMKSLVGDMSSSVADSGAAAAVVDATTSSDAGNTGSTSSGGGLSSLGTIGKVLILIIAFFAGQKVIIPMLRLRPQYWWAAMLVLFVVLFPGIGIQIGMIVLIAYVLMKLLQSVFK